MNTPGNNTSAQPAEAIRNGVKIFGVGGAGIAMLAALERDEFHGATFHGVDSEKFAVEGIETILLETRVLRGMGTGGDPERGRKLAEEQFERLKQACAGAELVFILTGLGGGAGSGIAPVLARAARESGAVTVGFVTLPFELEGNHRQDIARAGLASLKAASDGVICLANERALKLLDEHGGLMETFGTTGRLLNDAVRGVWRLFRHRGLIKIHFDQLCGLLRQPDCDSWFASVDSAGTTRAHDAHEKLAVHPLLDGDQALNRAQTILISIMAGPDTTLSQLNHFMRRFNQEHPAAKVIMGAAVDESFRDRLAVTVFAWSAATQQPGQAKPEAESRPVETKTPARESSPATVSAPVLNLDQREAMVAKSGLKGARARKAAGKMQQGTLQLDIVNRGRFDKTEATIRNGQDLDLPTFMRRGVKLN